MGALENQMAGELFDVVVEENVMVPMRDGVRLALDIYRPAESGKALEGPLPVLLLRTPYNKVVRENLLSYFHFFAQHGYIAAAQDCRGCYQSEGEVGFLIPEAEDGYDTLMWIKQQPWAGPKVGSWGTSWAGWTQTAMAALGPDNLGVMIPNMSGANAFTSSVRHNGALELRFIAWSFWHSAFNSQKQLKSSPLVDRSLRGNTPFSEWLQRWPIKRGQTQLRHVPPYEKWVMEMITREERDEFWQHPSMNPSGAWHAFPEMPVLYVGGWYDSYTRASLENFVGHSKAKEGPIKLLMGPWTHGADTMEKSFAGDVEFGSEAALSSFKELHLDIFDHYLREQPRQVSALPPIRLFVMGGGSGLKSSQGRLIHGGEWRDEHEWPLARTQFQNWYLHSTGVLATEPDPSQSSWSGYLYDPDHPVPSIGGNVSSHKDVPRDLFSVNGAPQLTEIPAIMEAGGFDQIEVDGVFGCKPPYLPLGSRGDVIVFQSEPLGEDMEVTGPLEARLWVSTSAQDTDFTIKLIDVYPPNEHYPDGYRLNLSDSILRLSFRDGSGIKRLVTPGEVMEISIVLYPTSNLFVKGHQIRVDISSSNFPRFDLNFNSGEPSGKGGKKVVAENRVYHDAAHPSHITLPLIPR
jgi:hypothetical protein|tara:strand:+ start:7988 stop:9886 length:1899 start_codon:yes stop_codon:yes gene_type:complete